jgi:hypothetical protein
LRIAGFDPLGDDRDLHPDGVRARTGRAALSGPEAGRPVAGAGSAQERM